MVRVGEQVSYEGDAVAILAAESQMIADQALELIEVEVDPLPVVSSPVQACEPDAPQLRESGNLMEHIKVRKGDLAQGFAEADLVIEETFTTPTMDHAFMEPECSVAVPTEDGRMTVYVASQIPMRTGGRWLKCWAGRKSRSISPGKQWGAALAARKILPVRSTAPCWRKRRGGR